MLIRIAARLFSVLTLLTTSSAIADGAWHFYKTGNGTAFEERWVGTTAIESMSSNKKLASKMHLAASLGEDDGLYVWVTHPDQDFCRFSDWKLAVDQSVVRVNSELGESTEATVLTPIDGEASEEFENLFREGERIAVRVRAECDNQFYLDYIGTATLTYSLSGSGAALNYLATGAPRPVEKPEVVEGSEPEAYYFALQQKIVRMWSAPPSTPDGLNCEVQVLQSRSGEVLHVQILKCNGDLPVKRSIEAAVQRASPLPVPANEALFNPTITFVFKPNS